MYANMNKPEQGITQIFAFIKIIKKNFQAFNVPTPKITLIKTVVQSILQLYNENIKWTISIQSWLIC